MKKTLAILLLLSFSLVYSKDNQDNNIIYLMPQNAPDSIKHRNKIDDRGNKFGVWEYYSQGGKLILTITYHNNKRDGVYKRFHPSTQKLFEEGSYQNSSKDGVYKRFFSNGSIRVIGEYDLGFKSGKWKYYYKDTETLRIEGRYKNGRKHGEWLFFDRKGLVNRKISYRNGQIIKSGNDTVLLKNKK